MDEAAAVRVLALALALVQQEEKGEETEHENMQEDRIFFIPVSNRKKLIQKIFILIDREKININI
jgi:hypothetical protein